MERSEVLSLLKLPLAQLISIADRTRRERAGDSLELCSIMNAKSGLCGEDCKFCAQSARFHTGVDTYPLKTKDEMLKAASRAKEIGAGRFDIVTSGNRLSDDELRVIAEAVREITANMGIRMCASLGSLKEEDFNMLKEAGLTRYHHNIETSRGYYPKIVSTHSFEDRLRTIGAAKACGLEVCSGGIIGLGESWDDRIDMAFTLKELGVDSVPLNFLVPIQGTPFESCSRISVHDALKTVAIFRIILEDKIIKIAAGRETLLKDSQALGFLSGANGMLIGGYLTIKGHSPENDHALIRQVKELWNA